MPKPPRSLRALALIIMILGTTMVILCGLCSGLIISAPLFEQNQGVEVAPGYYLLVAALALGFGAIGIVPGIVLIATGKALKNKPLRAVYGVLMMIFSVPAAIIGAILTSVRNNSVELTGNLILWSSLITFIGGIGIIIATIAQSRQIKDLKASPQMQAAKQTTREWKAKARSSFELEEEVIHHPDLKRTAQIILILTLIVLTLSGLCTVGFVIAEPKSFLAILGMGAIFMGVIGLMAFAMRRHIQNGPNLLSEIIATLFGLLTLGIGGIGLFFIGWAIWSMVVRKKAGEHD